ncbi:MAG: DUF2007 domain-containing protein [Xanthomonadaceae bacterium]|jgi:hypothetical protein|nr:DUF2007 domain-containing protein [Xanthomonadaceae bacterium]
MRQVFTSQRLETVEGVAKLLRDEGIEVHVSNRSYGQRRSEQFSYASPMPKGQQPAAWVRNADDQPRARAILRQAGLLETTRSDHDLPATATLEYRSPFGQKTGGTRWVWRIRLILLVVVAAVAMLIWTHRQHPPASPPAVEPHTRTAPAQEEEQAIRVRLTPPPASGTERTNR